jgi:lipoate-protein ligase B
MEFLLFDVGRMKYKDAWDLQRLLVDDRLLDRMPDALIMVEHDHVITFGRRSEGDGIGSIDGVELFRVERGGLATYHGPGQLVGYPIVKLQERFRDIKAHIHNIEETLVRTLTDFDIPAARREGHPGIWVDGRKIASIGVAVRERVTFHGFALNVDTDMRYFGLIEPCGLKPETMTSMSEVLKRKVSIENVKPVLLAKFKDVFGCGFVGGRETDQPL